MKENYDPLILAFCCSYCPYCSADMAGSAKLHYPSNVRIIRVPCIGTVGIIHILKALENGADGIFLAGCKEGKCQYSTGNYRALKRIQYVKKLFTKLSIEEERVEVHHLAAADAKNFCDIASRMTETIKRLGPIPSN